MDVLKALLIEKNKTVKDFCQESGVSRKTLDPYFAEKAKWANASAELLLKVSDTLDVDPHILINGKVEIRIVEPQKKEYIFFYSAYNEYGFLSNWYPCLFSIDGHTFCSSEQFMMYSKAKLFKDEKEMNIILNFCSPEKVKELKEYHQKDKEWEDEQKKLKHEGRNVENYDDKLWREKREEFVYLGILEKFRQNKDLRAKLISTGDKVLVEAARGDKIWGIGMGKSNKDIFDEKKWKGLNLLGKLLMKARKNLS